jgi:hypothetical protein
MLNFFLKWGQANHLTPTFIIEPDFLPFYQYRRTLNCQT